jgi:hypothetical protein
MHKVAPRYIIAGITLLVAMVWLQLPEMTGGKATPSLEAALHFDQARHRALAHAPSGAVFAEFGHASTGYRMHATNHFEVHGTFTAGKGKEPQRWSAEMKRDERSWIITRLQVGEKVIRAEDFGKSFEE